MFMEVVMDNLINNLRDISNNVRYKYTSEFEPIIVEHPIEPDEELYQSKRMLNIIISIAGTKREDLLKKIFRVIQDENVYNMNISYQEVDITIINFKRDENGY